MEVLFFAALLIVMLAVVYEPDSKAGSARLTRTQAGSRKAAARPRQRSSWEDFDPLHGVGDRPHGDTITSPEVATGSDDGLLINPATGLPMIAGIGSVDVGGDLYGTSCQRDALLGLNSPCAAFDHEPFTTGLGDDPTSGFDTFGCDVTGGMPDTGCGMDDPWHHDP